MRRDLEGQEVEEVQPVLPAREHAAILKARRNLENSKTRFVDDPSEALAEARRAVGQALEPRGYPLPEPALTKPRDPARKSSKSTRTPIPEPQEAWKA